MNSPPPDSKDKSASPSVSPSNRTSLLPWATKLLGRLFLFASSVILLFACIGLAQRQGWLTSDRDSSDQANGQTDAQGDRFICPMMCTPPQSQPGRCPVCGMKLVKASASIQGDGQSVTIDATSRRLVGIRTATSKSETVTRTIRSIGSIDFDESRLSSISAYVDGRLEQVYANYVGVKVGEGDDLALIYSPQLYSAQTEFLTAMDGAVGDLRFGGEEFISMARENLTELGMSVSQIENLQRSKKPQSRLRIKSPQTGTVLARPAVQGDYIKTGQKLFEIADLSSVWLVLDLFPDDASVVRFGQEVQAEVQSIQGEVFTGRISFIAPTVDPKTRTVRVRVEVMNFDGKLRPGDYATARISVPAIASDRIYDPALAGKFISPMHPQVIREQAGPCPLCGMDLVPTVEYGFSEDPLPAQRVVTVPRDAVLVSGDDGIVYVETEPGRFEIRRVTVGVFTETTAVIVSGLAAGEIVATDGNFLIDSQMQLAGNPSLLDPSRATRFTPAPLQLPSGKPVELPSPAGVMFDAAYKSYFEIQELLAADQTPPQLLLSELVDGLSQLEAQVDIPDEARRQFARARRAAKSMGNTLDESRPTFRTVSQALLRAAAIARGPETAKHLLHFHCPMVPGHGGDWMQPQGELANPYWGDEMLRCGQLINDLAIPLESESAPAELSEAKR